MCLPISCRRSLVLLNPPSCRSQQTRSKSSKFSNRTNAIRPESWSIGDLGQQSIPTTVLVFQSGSFNSLIPGACSVTCTQQVTTSYKTFFIINTVIVDFKKNGLCWALPELPIFCSSWNSAKILARASLSPRRAPFSDNARKKPFSYRIPFFRDEIIIIIIRVLTKMITNGCKGDELILMMMVMRIMLMKITKGL